MSRKQFAGEVAPLRSKTAPLQSDRDIVGRAASDARRRAPEGTDQAQCPHSDEATVSAPTPILPDAPAKLDDLALERLVSAALSQDHLGEARSLIAQAMSDGAASAAMLALCRAKIAMTARDFDAARSILVVAIEETPDVTALRSQLAEVLVAGGQAATARATIAVLGAAPVIPASQEADDTPDIDDPATRATSDS